MEENTYKSPVIIPVEDGRTEQDLVEDFITRFSWMVVVVVAILSVIVISLGA